MYNNPDLDNLITPVKVDKLNELLVESGYDSKKTAMLIDGFSNGFTLGYEGDMNVKITSPNLKFTVGDEIELWNKVMKEVKALRYAGPFEEIPFSDSFIQSPIGLVPKDGRASTRLIFHLSYPRNDSNTSVNANTPKEICTVKYPDFTQAVRLCLKEGKHCYCSKSDWKSAFRHFPIKRKFWRFLIMKARNPLDKKWYFFIDKCMPFGSSISCAHFQTFSNAILHVMTFKTGKENVNYLDDFLFIALLRWLCDRQTRVFLHLCEEINFPVSMEKTVWSCTHITFLGMLLDSDRQLILIPQEKLERALVQIERMLANCKRKAKILDIQKLCGLLNFLTRAIYPGRPFLMRLYNSLSGEKTQKLKQHHHVKLVKDVILDLEMWKVFLSTPVAFCRLFIDIEGCEEISTLDWFTDSAKAFGKGFGGHHKTHWFYGLWPKNFLDKDPSIEYLELYAVTVSVLLWLKNFRNKRVVIFCDNESVVHMINNQSSKCGNCMILIRIVTLQCLLDNVRLYAKHLRTHLNGQANALSRNQLDRFFKLSNQVKIKPDTYPEKFPEIVQCLDKLWIV